MAGANGLRALLIAAVAGAAALSPRAYAQDAPAAIAPTAPLPKPQQVLDREIGRLGVILVSTDPATSPDQREQAAERLAALNRPDGNAKLLDALRRTTPGPGVAEARVAVATALAAGRNPLDPAYLDPLRALLATDPTAAAPALARYAATTQAADAAGALSDLAIDHSAGVGVQRRLAAVNALGAFARRPVAAALIDLLNRPDENDDVRSAAADALANMTGLVANGRDAAKWNAWWQTVTQPNGPAFDEALASRVAALDHGTDELTARVGSLLRSTYNQAFNDYAGAPEDRKPEMARRLEALLLGWLRDTQPVFRATAVQIAYDQAQLTRPITRAVTSQLASMVGDASADVRRQVVISLREVIGGDADTVAALLAQLTVEPEDDVRVQIAATLGKFHDLRSVDALLALLDDPSPRVEIAAADAMGNKFALKDAIRNDPATRSLVSSRLQAKLREVSSRAGANGLRVALLGAAAPLGDRALRKTFVEALDRGDARNADERVRVAAARGLSGLTDPDDRDYAAQALIDAMASDPNADVRIAAVDGLRNVASFDRVSGALILGMTPARGNVDPTVRDRAWQVLQYLAGDKGVSADSVAQIAEQAIVKNDPAKRVVALQMVVDKLFPKAAGNPDVEKRIANVQQDIGDGLGLLKRFGDAVPHYRAALNYWQNNPEAAPQTLSSLSEKLERSYLLDGKYAAAVQFAGKRVESGTPDEEATMSTLIRDELVRLQHDKKWKEASQLVDEAINNMKPPFSQEIERQLEKTRLDIQRGASQGSEEFDPLAPLNLA